MLQKESSSKELLRNVNPPVLVEGFFCNGKRAKNLLDPVSLHLTPCFPLSIKWRGKLMGERVKGFLSYWRSFFYSPIGRRTKNVVDSEALFSKKME